MNKIIYQLKELPYDHLVTLLANNYVIDPPVLNNTVDKRKKSWLRRIDSRTILN